MTRVTWRIRIKSALSPLKRWIAARAAPHWKPILVSFLIASVSIYGALAVGSRARFEMACTLVFVLTISGWLWWRSDSENRQLSMFLSPMAVAVAIWLSTLPPGQGGHLSGRGPEDDAARQATPPNYAQLPTAATSTLPASDTVAREIGDPSVSELSPAETPSRAERMDSPREVGREDSLARSRDSPREPRRRETVARVPAPQPPNEPLPQTAQRDTNQSAPHATKPRVEDEQYRALESRVHTLMGLAAVHADANNVPRADEKLQEALTIIAESGLAEEQSNLLRDRVMRCRDSARRSSSKYCEL